MSLVVSHTRGLSNTWEQSFDQGTVILVKYSINFFGVIFILNLDFIYFGNDWLEWVVLFLSDLFRACSFCEWYQK